jgi:hypothetical protein
MHAVGASPGRTGIELGGLLDLAHRQKLAGAAKERIAGRLDRVRQAQEIGEFRAARQPLLAERDHLIGRPHGDELAHPERLKAIDFLRGLMAEAVGGDIEHEAARRNAAARCHQRIERVTGGRRQHQVGRRRRRHPLFCAGAADRGPDLALPAMQAADGAEQMRKAVQIARLLDMGAIGHRRKAQHFRAGRAQPRDQTGQPLHRQLEQLRSGAHAVDAARLEQRLQARAGRVTHNEVHLDLPKNPPCRSQSVNAGATSTRSAALAVLARMRLLLIMMDEDSASRRWRATLNSPSLR